MKERTTAATISRSETEILSSLLLREIEVRLASGSETSACRAAGISDATYYTWRKKFGGMARSQLSEMKRLEKENQRLKKIFRYSSFSTRRS